MAIADCCYAILLSLYLASVASSQTHSFTNEAKALCDELYLQIPSRVAYSTSYNDTQCGNLTAAYEEATTRYNNIANRDDVPACVLFPSTSTDVSVAMRLLSNPTFSTVPFALKSGGHDWNRGFSSTNGGLLISFRPYLNYTTLSDDKLSAEVGPGSRWAEALSVLDQQNRTIVGGRYGDVGVGGYLPRGGISFLTSQFGFGSDNVIAFEVVLANGSIVTASKHSHRDLFWALRGGGSLFGVVTKYTLQAHPSDFVWGGSRTYTDEQTPVVLSAITNFTANFNDVKAAIVPTVVKFGPGQDFGNGTTWRVDFFYNGTIPPSHIFAEFDAIKASEDITGIKRYPQVIGNSGSQPEFRAAGSFNSLPNLPEEQMTPFLMSVVERAHNATFVVNGQDIGFAFLNLAIQTLPVALQRANFDRGPAALTTDPRSGDKIWVEYTAGWNDPRCDFTCMTELRAVVDGVKISMQELHAGAEPTHWGGGEAEMAYKPIFFNDAMWGQDVYKSYGEGSYQRIIQIRKAYDPKELFLGRTSQFTL